MGSTDQADPNFFLLQNFMNMYWWNDIISIFLSPPLCARPQKSRTWTVSKTEYENFWPKILISYYNIDIYLGALKHQKIVITSFIVDVLRGQPIKLIQVFSTSEFHEYWWNNVVFLLTWKKLEAVFYHKIRSNYCIN